MRKTKEAGSVMDGCGTDGEVNSFNNANDNIFGIMKISSLSRDA